MSMTPTLSATVRSPFGAAALLATLVYPVRGLLGGKQRTAPQQAQLHHLSRNQISWIARPRGHRITCESGCLWITVDGEPMDLVLDAGEQFDCKTSSRVSVFALEDARVRLDGPGACFG